MDHMVATFDGKRQYVAGERVSCIVNLKCPEEDTKNPKVEKVNLYAIAVQLVGVFIYNEQWCAPPVDEPEKKDKKQLFPSVLPSLARNERLLFASPVVNVDEHVIQNPTDTYSFSFSEVLPKELPPTFRGSVGSYSYRIIVAYYRVAADSVPKPGSDNYHTITQIIHVVSPLSMARCIRSTIENVPFDPVVEHGDKISLSESQEAVVPVTAVKDLRDSLFIPVRELQKRYSQQICVNVMDNSAFVVRLVLPRTVLLPGQTLYWMCDFRGSDVLCQALEVHVVSEETIDSAIAYSKNVLKVSKDIYGVQSCNCSCLDLVPLSIGIPKDAIPEFSTKLISLKWNLVFKFHVVPNPGSTGIELYTSKIVNFSFPIHVISLPE